MSQNVSEATFAAFASAICDLVAGVIAEHRTLLDTLEKKGVVLATERIPAIKPDPDELAKLAVMVRNGLQKRMAEHYQTLSPPEPDIVQ